MTRSTQEHARVESDDRCAREQTMLQTGIMVSAYCVVNSSRNSFLEIFMPVSLNRDAIRGA